MHFVSSALLFASIAAAASIGRRSDSFHLYGYGPNKESDVQGLPLFYSDGNAYLGSGNPEGSTTNAYVLFTKPSTSSLTGTTWVISSSTDNITLSSDLVLAVNPSSTGSTPVTFTEPSNSSVLTDSFALLGSLATWQLSNGDMESYFYAAPTGTDGLYQLVWNAAADDSAGVKLALKTTAPVRKANVVAPLAGLVPTQSAGAALSKTPELFAQAGAQGSI